MSVAIEPNVAPVPVQVPVPIPVTLYVVPAPGFAVAAPVIAATPNEWSRFLRHEEIELTWEDAAWQ